MLELLLSNKDVQKLWLAQMLSFIGDWAALIALAGLLFDRTGSASWSTVPTIAAASGMLIGLLLAWVGDTYAKRTVIIAADIIRALSYGILGLFNVPLTLIVGLLVVAGVATTLFNGARGAIWQDVVPADKLQAVRSLSMATFAATTAIGSALGAGLWQTVGAKKAILCNAATFIISAILIARLKSAGKSRPGRRHNTLALARTIWAIPNFRRIILFSTFGSMAAETAERLVVPYAHAYASNAFASVLATVAAIGSLVGTISITRYLTNHFTGLTLKKQVKHRLKLGVLLQMVFYSLALLALALPANAVSAVAVFLAIGLFFSFASVLQPVAISIMPPGKQAGSFTLIEATNYGALLIGSILAGVSLRVLSPRATIAWMITATLSLLTFRYFKLFHSRV